MDKATELYNLMIKHVNEFADFAELDELEEADLIAHFSEFLMELADVIAD